MVALRRIESEDEDMAQDIIINADGICT